MITPALEGVARMGRGRLALTTGVEGYQIYAGYPLPGRQFWLSLKQRL